MSIGCALFDWRNHVKKKSGRLQTVLVILFLIGAAAFIIPVLSDLISYRQDEEEYEEISARVSLADSTSKPVLPFRTVTPVPSAEATDDPERETLSVLPTEMTPEATEAEGDAFSDDMPEIFFYQDEFAEAVPSASAVPSVAPDISEFAEETKAPGTSPAPRARSSPTVRAEPPVSATAVPAETAAPAKTGIDHEACRKQNSDYVAWLTIPGTKINYPVVRSDDTEYYLHHLFSRKESKLGTLFSLTSSDYQKPSRNIAIYGHHLSNSDAMFSTLLKYKSASYCADHSMIQLDTLYGCRSYQVFAVINMNVTDWDAATASFSGSDAFLRFVSRAQEASLFDTGIQIGPEDHILTLITCDRGYGSQTGRLVVMAVEQP